MSNSSETNLSEQPSKSEFSLPRIGASILEKWNQEDIFGKVKHHRNGGVHFSFYEGPPTANGKPGVHHALGRTLKDVFCRYKTMMGYSVDRKAGWDTHGLPVEIEVEKTLNIKSREDIYAFGIENYNAECKKSVLKYKKDWDRLTQELGYWIDLDKPYATFDNKYMESVWWLLQSLHKKELLYKGKKIHWYSPDSQTVLSSHEVSLGYKDVFDPSLTFKVRVINEDNTFFLVWTTTPWTLLSNAAVAINPNAHYVKVSTANGCYILAKNLLGQVFNEDVDYTIVHETIGSDLIGTKYEPLFDHFGNHPRKNELWRVLGAEFVETTSGTGLVHIAPAFGVDDNMLAKQHDLPLLNHVTPDGKFEESVKEFGGLWFKDADKPIIKHLKNASMVHEVSFDMHSYPHDWRKGTALLNYPVDSWFIATSKLKDKLVALNKTINWHPENIGSGRFGNWLDNNVDWALSRHRFWGTPLPIWVNDQDPSEYVVVGSVAELRSLAGDKVPPDSQLDLHVPHIDAITWKSPNGGIMRRVPEVIDVWFDSGAMPYAQWHYPFENAEQFEANYPADFIAEGIDQTRGWFYTLHAISSILFDKVAFKNVIVNGLILDENGEKMSKSKGNTVDPFLAIQNYGADALRWYMLSISQPWDNKRFSENGLQETSRKVFATIFNTCKFLSTYAEIDGFKERDYEIQTLVAFSVLDKWILSRLHSTIKVCTDNLESYNPTVAVRSIERFVEELSNWYLRRSRRLFWNAIEGSELSSDPAKTSAYRTLHFCLSSCAKMMAPFAPFFSDWLFRELYSDDRSVHLEDYPQYNESNISSELEQQMRIVRTIVNNTMTLRNREGINVRQPLRKIIVVLDDNRNNSVSDELAAIALEEVNIDEIKIGDTTTHEFVKWTLKPNFRILGKRLGSKIKTLPQRLSVLTDNEIQAWLKDGQIEILLDGDFVTFSGEDLEAVSTGILGWEVESSGGITVAIDTALNEDLLARGLAREIVNRIQSMRKDLDLDYTDQIYTFISTEDKEILQRIENTKSYIMGETLSVKIEKDIPVSTDMRKLVKIHGKMMELAILFAQ